MTGRRKHGEFPLFYSWLLRFTKRWRESGGSWTEAQGSADMPFMHNMHALLIFTGLNLTAEQFHAFYRNNERWLKLHYFARGRVFPMLSVSDN